MHFAFEFLHANDQFMPTINFFFLARFSSRPEVHEVYFSLPFSSSFRV